MITSMDLVFIPFLVLVIGWVFIRMGNRALTPHFRDEINGSNVQSSHVGSERMGYMFERGRLRANKDFAWQQSRVVNSGFNDGAMTRAIMSKRKWQ